MKTLHAYLTRQIVGTLSMTVLVFTFVLLLGTGIKDLMPVLLNNQTSIWVLPKAIGLLIPYVLVYALPMGLLTATLLTFGRLSSEHELTAVRASGISLISLITPVLVLSVLLSGVAALINLKFAPLCRTAFKQLITTAITQNPAALLQEKQYVQYIKASGRYVIYINTRNDDELGDIEISQLDDNGTLLMWARAPKGIIIHEAAGIKLHLTDSLSAHQDNGEWKGVTKGDFDLPWQPDTGSIQVSSKLSDMSFTQLRAKVDELEALNRQQPDPERLPPDLREQLKKSKGYDLAMPAKVQLHRMVSFSFACIGFTLVGIPLGIRAHRRETSIGIAVALILVIVYYSFLILGGALESRPAFQPHLIVWLPNLIFQVVGGALLWRANKGLY